MFNLQQLETLVMCVECGSFSAAARKLGKAQSAVSTTISNLEIDTGLTIFDRTSRLPTLTAQGERLHAQAISLLEHAQHVQNMLQTFNVGVEDRISIGINALLLTPQFFGVIEEFYQQFPHTELNLNVLKNNDIADAVASNEVDIGFMLWGSTQPKNVLLGSIGYVPFSIAVHQSHPLLAKGSVSFETLKAYRQIVLQDYPAHYNANLSNSLTKVNDLETVIELIKLNNNWSLIPDHLFQKHSDIVPLKLQGEEKDWLLQIDRVTGKAKEAGPVMQWLTERCLDFYPSVQPKQQH